METQRLHHCCNLIRLSGRFKDACIRQKDYAEEGSDYTVEENFFMCSTCGREVSQACESFTTPEGASIIREIWSTGGLL